MENPDDAIRDESPPQSLEEALAELTPEQRAAINQQRVLNDVFNQPMGRPARWTLANAQDPAGRPVLIMKLETPEASMTVILARDDALAFAGSIRKAAQTGPELIVPNGAGRLLVPGA